MSLIKTINEMNPKDFVFLTLIYAVSVAGWGIFTQYKGIKKGYKEASPSSVYLKDINLDEIPDIIVESKHKTNIFIGNSSANFFSLDSYKSNQLNSIREKERELESSVKKMQKSVEEKR